MTTSLLSPVNRETSSTLKTTITSDLDTHLRQVMKAYQADQQVKYLHLQAEIEVLLQQLQTLKQQKQKVQPSK